MPSLRLITGFLLAVIVFAGGPGSVLAALCPGTSSPWDVVIVMDVSGSMNGKADTANDRFTKIQAAISAGTSFAQTFAQANPRNEIGLVSFSDDANLENPLTRSYSQLAGSLRRLNANGGTCLQCGIRAATQELSHDTSSGNKKAVVVLTDGLASRYLDANNVSQNDTNPAPTLPTDDPIAQAKALDEAASAWMSQQISFFTVGVGAGVSGAYLTTLAATGHASAPPAEGFYRYAAADSDIDNAFNKISRYLGQGELAGTVFLDVNHNGTYDAGDSGVPGLTVGLYDSANALISQTTTGSDGSYVFPSLCNGSYDIRLSNLPADFVQTVPAGAGGNHASISFGNLHPFGLNFGLAAVAVPVESLSLKLSSGSYVTTSTNIQNAPGVLWPTGNGAQLNGYTPSLVLSSSYTGSNPQANVSYAVWADCSNNTSTVVADVTLACGTPVSYARHTISIFDSFSLDNQIRYTQAGSHFLKVISQRGLAAPVTAIIPINVIDLTFQAQAASVPAGTAPAFSWTTGNADAFAINGEAQIPVAQNTPTTGRGGYTAFNQVVTAAQTFTGTASNDRGSIQLLQDISLAASAVARFCGGE